MKVRKEGLELQDWFEMRSQTRIQRELEEDRRREDYEAKQIQQRQAELAAAERRRFESRWIGYALSTGKPCDSPGDYALLVRLEIMTTLSNMEPDEDENIVRELVDSAIVQALGPWRTAEEKQRTRRRGIESALSTLPFEMRWDSDWSARATKTAAQAADQAREDAAASEIAAAAKTALQPLAAEHRHLSKIRDAAKHVVLPNGSYDEDQEAREAVTQALAALPLGASDRTIEQAKATALAPLQQRIAARVQARERQNAKERLVAVGLNEVFWYARRLTNEFDYEPDESPSDIDRRTRSEVENTLRAELDGTETEDRVRDRVHGIMEEIEGCE
jgi:hypothetical protein